jgi:hypothetical protein
VRRACWSDLDERIGAELGHGGDGTLTVLVAADQVVTLRVDVVRS